MVMDHRAHEHWSNGTTFLLAAIASAVGVGNIWRFPYMAAENGGGAFLIPYLIGIILFGIPLMILEFVVGSRLKRTPLCVFKKLVGNKYLISYIPLILNFVIVSYYVVVTGWTLSYFLLSLSGGTIAFSDYITTENSLYSTFAVICLLFVIMRAGIKKGLENLNKYLIPIFLLSFAVLLIGSISVYGLGDALNYYLTVEPEFLFNTSTWVLAFSQAFFSLGVGWCIMLTYGAYIRNIKKTNIVGSSIIVSIVDTLIALFAGLLVFTLAFGNNIPLGEGPSLAFDTLPIALSSLPLADIVLPIFFLLLFSAALTSAVSLLEVPLTMVEDELGTKRRNSVTLLIVLLVIAALPSALSYSIYGFNVIGMPILDFLDSVVVGRLAPLAILVTTALLAWGYKDLEKELEKVMDKVYVKPFLILVKYIIPVFLGFLFLSQFVA